MSQNFLPFSEITVFPGDTWYEAIAHVANKRDGATPDGEVEVISAVWDEGKPGVKIKITYNSKHTGYCGCEFYTWMEDWIGSMIPDIGGSIK